MGMTEVTRLTSEFIEVPGREERKYMQRSELAIKVFRGVLDACLPARSERVVLEAIEAAKEITIEYIKLA